MIDYGERYVVRSKNKIHKVFGPRDVELVRSTGGRVGQRPDQGCVSSMAC